jgi:hypothetical protein
MKKVLFLLFSALVVCSGCDIHKTEVIKPGVDIYTHFITVSPTDWERNNVPEGEAGCYIYCTYQCKEIDRNVMDDGAVAVYLVDSKEGVNPLPYAFTVESKSDFILENIRFNVKKGFITFVVEWDDADIYEIDYDMKFKVCVFAPEE